MFVFAAITVIIASILGVVLTIFSLPGIWFMLLVGLACKVFWVDELFSWWVLGAVLAIVIIAEISDFATSAIGASKAGGSKSAAWGAVVGSIVGAILGTPLIPIPVVGTIVGAVIGAGLGAVIIELGVHQKTLKDSAKVGGGAAAGRLAAVLIKGTLAVLAAVIFTVAVIV
jgi:uncharacterized protein